MGLVQAETQSAAAVDEIGKRERNLEGKGGLIRGFEEDLLRLEGSALYLHIYIYK